MSRELPPDPTVGLTPIIGSGIYGLSVRGMQVQGVFLHNDVFMFEIQTSFVSRYSDISYARSAEYGASAMIAINAELSKY